MDRSLSILNHDALEILGGFQALMIVGEALTISRNRKLVTIGAFNAIEYFLDGKILIEDNPELVSIETFNKVYEVQQDIVVRRNDALILLDSFHSLQIIGTSLTVAFNPKLADCKLPPKLTTLSGSIFVEENAATSSSLVVKGPLVLHSVGGTVEITGNQVLTDVSGFDFDGGTSKVQKIVIAQNTFGATSGSFDIGGFSSLGSVPGGIVIEGNERMRLVSGFQFSGAGASVGSITIQDNSATPFAVNITGFDGLSTCGDVIIDASNLGLLSGFSFVSVSNSKVGRVSITNNNPPSDLAVSAFTGLASAGNVVIEASKLADLSGFSFVSGLSASVGDVAISNNNPSRCLSVSGFTGLSAVGDVIIHSSRLGELSGFTFVPEPASTVGNVSITENTCDGGVSVTGFTDLTVAENVDVVGNVMTSITGFTFSPSAMPSVRNIDVASNARGTSGNIQISGFTNLVMASGAAVSVTNNKGLATVQGFAFSAKAHSSIYSVNVSDNSGLELISGFTSLHTSTTVGSLAVVDNEWSGANSSITATGFSGFRTIGTASVDNNRGLAEIHGVNYAGAATADLISVSNNDAIKDISGFEGLIECAEKVAVLNNPYLKTISGFASLAATPLVQVLTNDRLESICGLASISFPSLEYADNGNALDSGISIAIPFEHIGLALRSHTTPFELRCDNAPACEPNLATEIKPSTQKPTAQPPSSTPSSALSFTTSATADIVAGSTAIAVDDITGVNVGDRCTFGTGASAETLTVASVSASRRRATAGTVTFEEALSNSYPLGSTATFSPAPAPAGGGSDNGTSSSQQDGSECAASTSNAAVIALIVVVVLLSLAIIAILVYFWQKKRAQDDKVRADLFLAVTESPAEDNKLRGVTPAGGVAVKGEFY